MGEEIKTVKINGKMVTELKKFVANNGGTIKSALEKGAVWVMTSGAKEYIKSLKSEKGFK